MTITANEFECIAGALTLGVNGEGRLTKLARADHDTDFLLDESPSYLAQIIREGQRIPEAPLALRWKALSASDSELCLRFSGGVEVTLRATAQPGWLRLQVTAVTPADAVRTVVWGPYHTTLNGLHGDFLGLARGDDFGIGLMSLDPGTDGFWWQNGFVAVAPCDGGSQLCLQSVDGSRDRAVQSPFARPALLAATGAPELGLEHARIALFGCAPDVELARIACIEDTEGLPHPVSDGVWNKEPKRTDPLARSSFWSDYAETDIDEYLELAKLAGVGMLHHGNMFGNWGHFAPNPELFPSGTAGIDACCRKMAAAGMAPTVHTLSTFIREKSLPEPFIAPRPDARLQHALPLAILTTTCAADADTIRLRDDDGVLEAFAAMHARQCWTDDDRTPKVVRIGNELIVYTEAVRGASDVILQDCTRGSFGTAAVVHAAGEVAARMVYAGYLNFYPGDVTLLRDVADQIVRVSIDTGSRLVCLDGVEACLETGHGATAMNHFHQHIHARVAPHGMATNGSCLTNYAWHMTRMIGWGEFELEKGFRGSQLDWRLRVQERMLRNHMPRRLGQYHPTPGPYPWITLPETTRDDIDWVMAQAAGWDVPVDFYIHNQLFRQNPHYVALLRRIRRWESARLAGAFTETERLRLRQTDCLFRLEDDGGGRVRLRFAGRWISEKMESGASDAIGIAATSDMAAVAPCSIDWAWTHNPGLYAWGCLSDDLIGGNGETLSTWRITPPQGLGAAIGFCTQPTPAPNWEIGTPGQGAPFLQFVLRVPADAPGAVHEPILLINEGNDGYLRIPVTLEPGQYLATPHEFPRICLYGPDHTVMREIRVRELPRLPSHPFALSMTVTQCPSQSRLILNLRMQRPEASC
jgi:hypothetical protein